MKPLYIVHKFRTVIYLIVELGVLAILIINIKEAPLWIPVFCLFLLYIIYKTIHGYKSSITAHEETIEIKWTSFSSTREVLITNNEIKKILFFQNHIDIQLMDIQGAGKGSFVMSLEHLNYQTRIKVNEYLEEYAQNNKVAYEKRY